MLVFVMGEGKMGERNHHKTKAKFNVEKTLISGIFH